MKTRYRLTAADARKLNGDTDDVLRQVERTAKNGGSYIIVPLLKIDAIRRLTALGYSVVEYSDALPLRCHKVSWSK